jgi:hypothetical protein
MQEFTRTMLTTFRKAFEYNTDSKPTAICPRAISRTSRLGTGLVLCIAVSTTLSLSSFDTLLNISHTADIPLVFGTHYEFRGNSTELEWETSYSMEGRMKRYHAFRFTHTDERQVSGTLWPPSRLIRWTVLVTLGPSTARARSWSCLGTRLVRR